MQEISEIKVESKSFISSVTICFDDLDHDGTDNDVIELDNHIREECKSCDTPALSD